MKNKTPQKIPYLLSSRTHKKYERELDAYLNEYRNIDETNAEKAQKSFCKKWSKLCPYLGTTKSFQEDGASKYGQALVQYSSAIYLLPSKVDEVSHLEDMIRSYDNDNNCRYKMHIKEALYFNLGLCWHKLGVKYDDDAVTAFKKYLFHLLGLSNNTSFAGLSAFAFRKCNEFLYKSLISEQLNISSPTEFNDPFDCPILVLMKKYADDVNKLILKAYEDCLKIACFSRRKKLFPEIDEHNNLITDEYGSPVFNNKHDVDRDEYLNELMWAHYADFHRGICIKYHFNRNMTSMISDSESVISFFGDIQYSDDGMSEYSNKESILAKHSFFLKGKSWEYENELRYLFFDIEGTGKNKQIEIPNCIEAIYFGVKCSQSDKDTIMKILKGKKLVSYDLRNKKTESDIELYQMEMDMNQFGQLKAVKIL